MMLAAAESRSPTPVVVGASNANKNTISANRTPTAYTIAVIARGSRFDVPVTANTRVLSILREVAELTVSEKEAALLGDMNAVLFHEDCPLQPEMAVGDLPSSAVLHLHTCLETMMAHILYGGAKHNNEGDGPFSATVASSQRGLSPDGGAFVRVTDVASLSGASITLQGYPNNHSTATDPSAFCRNGIRPQGGLFGAGDSPSPAPAGEAPAGGGIRMAGSALLGALLPPLHARTLMLRSLSLGDLVRPRYTSAQPGNAWGLEDRGPTYLVPMNATPNFPRELMERPPSPAAGGGGAVTTPPVLATRSVNIPAAAATLGPVKGKERQGLAGRTMTKMKKKLYSIKPIGGRATPATTPITPTATATATAAANGYYSGDGGGEEKQQATPVVGPVEDSQPLESQPQLLPQSEARYPEDKDFHKEAEHALELELELEPSPAPREPDLLKERPHMAADDWDHDTVPRCATTRVIYFDRRGAGPAPDLNSSPTASGSGASARAGLCRLQVRRDAPLSALHRHFNLGPEQRLYMGLVMVADEAAPLDFALGTARASGAFKDHEDRIRTERAVGGSLRSVPIVVSFATAAGSGSPRSMGSGSGGGGSVRPTSPEVLRRSHDSYLARSRSFEECDLPAAPPHFGEHGLPPSSPLPPRNSAAGSQATAQPSPQATTTAMTTTVGFSDGDEEQKRMEEAKRQRRERRAKEKQRRQSSLEATATDSGGGTVSAVSGGTVAGERPQRPKSRAGSSRSPGATAASPPSLSARETNPTVPSPSTTTTGGVPAGEQPPAEMLRRGEDAARAATKRLTKLFQRGGGSFGKYKATTPSGDGVGVAGAPVAAAEEVSSVARAATPAATTTTTPSPSAAAAAIDRGDPRHREAMPLQAAEVRATVPITAAAAAAPPVEGSAAVALPVRSPSSSAASPDPARSRSPFAAAQQRIAAGVSKAFRRRGSSSGKNNSSNHKRSPSDPLTMSASPEGGGGGMDSVALVTYGHSSGTGSPASLGEPERRRSGGKKRNTSAEKAKRKQKHQPLVVASSSRDGSSVNSQLGYNLDAWGQSVSRRTTDTTATITTTTPSMLSSTVSAATTPSSGPPQLNATRASLSPSGAVALSGVESATPRDLSLGGGPQSILMPTSTFQAVDPAARLGSNSTSSTATSHSHSHSHGRHRSVSVDSPGGSLIKVARADTPQARPRKTVDVLDSRGLPVFSDGRGPSADTDGDTDPRRRTQPWRDSSRGGSSPESNDEQYEETEERSDASRPEAAVEVSGLRVTVQDPRDLNRFHFNIPVEPDCEAFILREWMTDCLAEIAAEEAAVKGLFPPAADNFSDGEAWDLYCGSELIADPATTFREVTFMKNDCMFALVQRKR